MIHVINHPIALHNLTLAREVGDLSMPARFRHCMRRLAQFLVIEATRSLPTFPVEIMTPLDSALCPICLPKVALVPILRAGLPMLDGALDILPEATILPTGIKRDEDSLKPSVYRPIAAPSFRIDLTIILDPMIATGGTMREAIEQATPFSKTIAVCSAIAALPTIGPLANAFPDVEFFLGAVDPILNSRGYIVPGLGDAGDRCCGT